ncbi:MAG: NADPH-dependent F420 reductase [Anaerolineales bacterium]
MKIAIIGAGNIGGTLGKKWADAAHEVRFGVRNPTDSKYEALRSWGTVASVAEVLSSADVVLVSIPGAAVGEFARQHGAALNGKVIIDAANNPRSAVLNNFEHFQNLPGVSLVRAFSTLGWENFANPEMDGIQIDLFYCGAASARSTMDTLIAQIGLRPIYAGEVDAVNLVDAMTRLWFALAFNQGKGRRISFKMLEDGWLKSSSLRA